MTSGRLRGIFFTVIVLTVPFYCIGAVLLIGRMVFPPPLRSTPTPQVSNLPSPGPNTPAGSAVPSVTPILGITSIPTADQISVSPTSIVLLNNTPTQIFLLETPTEIVLLPTIMPIVTLGSPTPQGGAASCRDFTGNALLTIRADIPGNAAPGANIYCRLLERDIEIGNASVLSRGVQLAVDVSALTSGGAPVTRFSQSVKICLQGFGSIVYLDATQAPRAPKDMSITIEDGYTCTRINNAGTVVLVKQ